MIVIGKYIDVHSYNNIY